MEKKVLNKWLHYAVTLILSGVMAATALFVYAGPPEKEANTVDSSADKALSLAVREGNTAQVALLLQNGANPNGLFTLELLNARREIAALLIQHGADINELSDGNAPIHEAIVRDHPRYMYDHVQWLIAHGANINLANNDGVTPLLMAITRDYNIAKLLVQQGAQVNQVGRRGDDIMRTTTTPLLLAIIHSCANDPLIALLMQYGADPHLAINGDTPLHLAAQWGHRELVQLLITQHRADVNLANNYGNTPLHLAAQWGHPLHLPAQQAHRELVQLLVIQHRADVNRVNNNGNTPVHLAAQQGRHEVVQLLIEQGANTNLANNNGDTPIHLATERGHREVLQLLLPSLVPTRGILLAP